MPSNLSDRRVSPLRARMIEDMTMRKRWRRCRAEETAGLEDRSHRPHRAAGQKIFAEHGALIFELRRARQRRSPGSSPIEP
jgi:hypothetical protein